MATASILTIGNELVSGDVPNTNGSWIAKRLAPLGVETRLLAAVPDEIETIAEFVRREAPRVDFLVVTGGLGGTPDDLTREALAFAFEAMKADTPASAAELELERMPVRLWCRACNREFEPDCYPQACPGCASWAATRPRATCSPRPARRRTSTPSWPPCIR